MTMTAYNKTKQKDYNKAYYEANTRNVCARAKAYREANKKEVANRKTIYYEANKATILARDKAYREANKEERAAQQKAYYETNKEERAAQQKAYREANKEERAAQQKAYYETNKATIRVYMKTYQKVRCASDPQFRLARVLRKRIWDALNGTTKSARTEVLLGCTFAEFRVIWDHMVIASGYSSDDDLHIDHLIPCKAFDLTTPEGQQACFHYSNLHPLRAAENIRKGAKRPSNADLTAQLMALI
jgi:hypothetical protein